MRRAIDLLLRHRFLAFGIAVIAVVGAWPVAARLSFDQSIESLYSDDDPHLCRYTESKRLFGGDEFVIVAYTAPDLFTEEGFGRLRAFARRLSLVPGIVHGSTQNLADALEPPDLPVNARRILNRLHQDKLHELFRGILLGEDGQTTAVVMRLQDERSAAIPRAETIAIVRELAATHDPPAQVVGEPVQVHDMFRYVEEDGSTLFWVSLAVLATVIFILFRSLRWVVLPLFVVVAAIVWTEALLVASRMKLSMVSSMLNSLMTIIGIATVTHVTVRFREHRSSHDPLTALRETLVELTPAVFWTCATTAVGFAALLSSSITPVRSFGIMMASGTMMVLVAAAAILPGGILLGGRGVDPHDAPAENHLVRFLHAAIQWVAHRQWHLAIATVLLVGFSAAGFWRLDVETEFSRNFRKSSSIVQALDFVEQKLGGAGTWEINFSVPNDLSDNEIDCARSAADELKKLSREEPSTGLRKVLSLVDGLDLIPNVLVLFGNRLEKKRERLREIQPDFEPSLYNADKGRMRLVLRASERQQASSKRELIERAESIVRKQFPDAQATGLFVLLTFLIESLLRDQLTSFLLAAAGVGTMLMFAFRSVRLGLISLVPNLFPIVLVIGTMGWIGLPINIATAMIASVSMGLTVDSSIHYMTVYRRARSRGEDTLAALEETQTRVGRALVFANLALIVGFSVLTLSHFIPLVYFGILVSVAMFGGLAGNLLLLPLLLLWLDRGADGTTAVP